MSYSRKYSETITVRGSKTVTVSYPKSESGGSKSVTVDYIENVPVDVNIHVDTDPFDSSVSNCNTNVNLLTGAVVATEAAQLISIDKNSKKVASTIVSGFFVIHILFLHVNKYEVNIIFKSTFLPIKFFV